jgi:hypothetical protein
MDRRRFLRAAGAGAVLSALPPVRAAARRNEDAHPDTPTSPDLYYHRPLPAPERVLNVDTDLCVYGATPAGIAAAVQARRMGKTVVLLAFDGHLGGLTSGGLGATDIGNKAAIGGIAREFYRRLGAHYDAALKDDPEQHKAFVQQTDHGPETWKFEPGVAEETLRALCRENSVPVYYHQRLTGVRKEGTRIAALTTEGGHAFTARYFVDASYEGDLLAKAGVSYTVGREANATYGETYNGVHFGHPNHNFAAPVDPFVVPGDPKSGLLPGISADPPGEQGAGDKRVQAYNFRLCMTRAADRLPFPKPAGYDPARYELLPRYIAARGGKTDALNLTVGMPRGKTDTNNYGGFSSDHIGANYGWADGTYEERERIFQDHVSYHQGMVWFLCHDPRVPEALREDVKRWGLPRDEFRGTGHWPHQLYIREARRMVSDHVMTEHHCKWEVTVPDAIGLGAYGMDSHNCQRVARQENGVWTARNEGNVEYKVAGPYPVAYRSIVPQASECENLLVPVCLSASHIAYGSIRMEPFFFVLGQSAATAACLLLDADPAGRTPVQKVDTGRLQARLRADGQVLAWKAPRVSG